MKKTLGLCVIALSGVVFATSCNRDDDKTPICKMSSIVETNNSSIRTTAITYDEGKIASLVTAGGEGSSKQFSYSGNNFTIINKNGSGAITSTQDVTLNTFGKINTIIEKTPTGIVTKTISYEYDNNGNLTKFTEVPTVGVSKVTSFTFNNGNASTVLDANGNVTQIDYYTDKGFLDGDISKLIQILNTGALAVINKNLVKSATVVGTPNQVTTFNYEFDNAGKITKATLSGASSLNYTYTYDCK